MTPRPAALPLLLVLVAGALGSACDDSSAPSTPMTSPAPAAAQRAQGTHRAPPPPAGRAEAIFAGGCFWCVEAAFEGLAGVESVLSGYTGGAEEAPTYRQVSSGRTGHYEAVRVLYDPAKITYAALLELFLRNVDPTQSDGQFCDLGPQYRAAIFVRDASERALAEAAVARAAERLRRSVFTAILPVGPFWIAEAYHQDYHRTHAAQYRRYREGCRRDERLQEVWGGEAGGHAP